MLKVFNDLYERYFAEEEAIIFTLLIVTVLAIIIVLGGVIAPLLWSIVITFLLQGLVNFLKRRNVPGTLAMYLVYFIFIGAFLLAIFKFLPFTWGRLILFVNEMPNMVNQLRSLLMLLPENYPELFTETEVVGWINDMQGEVGQLGQTALSYSVASITRLITLLVYIVLVPILVFFMLKDTNKLLTWLESWLPEKRPIMAQIWHEMNDQLANYIRGKATEIIIVGGVSYVMFIFFGINYPLLLSVLIAFSVIIPYVGAAVASIPLLFVGVFQWGFTSDLYQVLFAYAILQLIDGNILVPLIFSETVNLHPIAIITAVLVFGGIWGFWGVFFAIPLATFIKAIIRAWPSQANVSESASKIKE